MSEEKINRNSMLRNLSITIMALVAVGALIFGLADSPMRNGMIAQLLAGIISITVGVSAGAYSHRKVFPDIRPHLFETAKSRIWASLHRLVWIGFITLSLMAFLSNSGVV